MQTVVRRRVDLIDGGEDDIAVRAELLAGEGEARAADGDGAQDEASVVGVGAQCFRTATCAAADRLRTRMCAPAPANLCAHAQKTIEIILTALKHQKHEFGVGFECRGYMCPSPLVRLDSFTHHFLIVFAGI